MEPETDTAVATIDAGIAHMAVEIDALSPDAENLRAHDDRSIRSIMGSLRRYGQVKPIVATLSGTVVAGNGTLEAARRLGWAHVAVSWFEGGARAARAYGIADNKTAEASEWDERSLRELARGLADTDPVLVDEMALSGADLDALFADKEPAQWKVEPGPGAGALGADTRHLTNMAFETDREKSVVQSWFRLLRRQHPDAATPGDRLIAHIRGTRPGAP